MQVHFYCNDILKYLELTQWGNTEMQCNSRPKKQQRDKSDGFRERKVQKLPGSRFFLLASYTFSFARDASKINCLKWQQLKSPILRTTIEYNLFIQTNEIELFILFQPHRHLLTSLGPLVHWKPQPLRQQVPFQVW